MMFARAYPRETQEMVFDAHDHAFAFFKSACTRGVYDKLKTAVETIFVGKDRQGTGKGRGWQACRERMGNAARRGNDSLNSP